MSTAISQQHSKPGAGHEVNRLFRCLQKIAFSDVTSCVLSPCFLMPSRLQKLLPDQSTAGWGRWAGLPQTGGWCQHNGGQQSHYSAFCCNWCQHMSRVPTPPHHLHCSHPLPSVLCAQSPLVAAPLLLLPIINLFWWSLAPSLAVNPPYQWLICISTREKVNRYKTYSVKIRVNKC